MGMQFDQTFSICSALLVDHWLFFLDISLVPLSTNEDVEGLLWRPHQSAIDAMFSGLTLAEQVHLPDVQHSYNDPHQKRHLCNKSEDYLVCCIVYEME